MVELDPRKMFGRKIGRTAKPAIVETTGRLASKSKAKLARHRDTGASQVFALFGRIDGYVCLDDPLDAMAIEFGHAVTAHGEYTGTRAKGLHILTGPAGLSKE